jgi:O-antigen ligase
MLGIFAVSCLFFSTSANIPAGLYFARLSVYLLFILYFIYHCSKQKQVDMAVKISTCIYVAATIVSGILQYFYYPNLRNLFYDGWDPHYYRMFGTFLEPVIAASVYGIVLIYALTEKRIQVYFRAGIALIMGVMMVMTFSRAALLALLVTALVFAARTKAIKLVLAGLLIAGVIFILLPKPSGEGVNMFRTSTIFSRATDYQEGVSIWQRSPIFGIGYNHLGAVKAQQRSLAGVPNHAASSLHSSFLIILATGGIIGVLLFANWFVQLMGISEFYKYALIFIGVSSLFDNVLLHPFVLLLMGVLGSLSANRLFRTSA